MLDISSNNFQWSLALLVQFARCILRLHARIVLGSRKLFTIRQPLGTLLSTSQDRFNNMNKSYGKSFFPSFLAICAAPLKQEEVKQSIIMVQIEIVLTHHKRKNLYKKE